MNNQELIKLYIEDEKFLLETWSKKDKCFREGIPYTSEHKGVFDSLENIKQDFLKWMIKNQKKLYILICKDSDYMNKKDLFKSSVDIAIELSKILGDEYTNSVEISVLLVNVGLEKICQEQQ